MHRTSPYAAKWCFHVGSWVFSYVGTIHNVCATAITALVIDVLIIMLAIFEPYDRVCDRVCDVVASKLVEVAAIFSPKANSSWWARNMMGNARMNGRALINFSSDAVGR